MDLELDMTCVNTDENLWDEFKFSDTDEDWSMPSGEECCEDNLLLERLADELEDLEDTAPKVQDALSHLELLASNTSTSGSMTIPSFCPEELGPQLYHPRPVLLGEQQGGNDDKFFPYNVLTPRNRVISSSKLGNKLSSPLLSDKKRKLGETSILYNNNNSSLKGGVGKPLPKRMLSMNGKKEDNNNDERNHKNSRGKVVPLKTTSTNIVTRTTKQTTNITNNHHYHTKKSTKAGKTNSCEYCLRSFDTQDLLQKHRQTHMSSDGKSYCCTFDGCKKIYCTGEGLRLHVRNVHLMAKNWKCLAEGCSRAFVRQSDLRMHIIRIHSNVRPYPCPVDTCNKSFACHSELRRHVHSCHKRPCPKPEKQTKNYVDPSFIQGLMLKTE